MPNQIRFRRGTAAQWTSANPVLALSELGYEQDTGKVKIGDGATAWNALAYGLLSAAANLSDLASVTTARTNLGLGTAALLGIDTDTALAGDSDSLIPSQKAVKAYAQPSDGELSALAALISAADKLPYFMGAGTAALADFTALARTLIAQSTAAAMRSTLGVTLSLPDIQVFAANASPQTWTKPAGAAFADVLTVQPGAGGGAGRRGAAGTVRTGGAGGAGGASSFKRYRASLLSSTETVTVGLGGAGAPAVTVDSTNGAAGSNAPLTWFKSSAFAESGVSAGGAGGSISAASASLGGALGGAAGGNGGASSTTAAGSAGATVTTGGVARPGTGGGGGGTLTAADASTAGGTGGLTTVVSTGTAGAVNGGNGGNGVAPGNEQGGTGGGGGGGGNPAGGNGGNGGNGGFPGGGGGGGGGSLNGSAPGAGGNGGDGLIIVFTWGTA